MHCPLRMLAWIGVACFVLIGASFAADPELIWHKDVNSAWKEAQKENRPVLMYVTMDDCLYCKRMERDTLADTKIRNAIKQNFVPVTVNRSGNRPLLRRLRVRVFPTTVVIGLDGRLRGSIAGYADREEFDKQLQDWTSTRIGVRLDSVR